MTREECLRAAERLAAAAEGNAGRHLAHVEQQAALAAVAQAQATTAAVYVALAAMREAEPKPPVVGRPVRDWPQA